MRCSLGQPFGWPKYFLAGTFGFIVSILSLTTTGAGMRTDECTFKEMRTSMTKDEFAWMYLRATKRIEESLSSNTKMGEEILEGSTEGLSYSNMVVEMLQGPDAAGNYVLDAIGELEKWQKPRSWQNVKIVTGNVTQKALQIIVERYRKAKSSGATKIDASGSTEEWVIHEHVYSPDVGSIRQGFEQQAQGPDADKKDRDALKLFERLLSDTNAVRQTKRRGVTFNESYICEREGWTKDEFRHARRRLVELGSGFLRSFETDQEKLPGFVFLQELKDRHIGG